MKNEVDVLLQGLQDLPLKSAYYQACFLLHCAEKGWLTVEQLSHLIKEFGQFDKHLSASDKDQNYRRLIQLTVVHKLKDDEQRLRSRLIALGNETNNISNSTLVSVKPNPGLYSIRYQDILKNCVEQRHSQENKTVNDVYQQQNTRDTDQLEARIWFDVATPLLLERLKEVLQKDGGAAVAILQRLANVAERLAVEKLYDQARAVYQEILQAFFDVANIARVGKSAMHQSSSNQLDATHEEQGKEDLREKVDEQCLVSMLVKISEAERGKQPIVQASCALKPQWPLTIVAFSTMRQTTTVQTCTADFQQFITHLFKTVEDFIGPPPCAYAVLGMGSFARGDMTPSSDLEAVILVANTVYKNYFKVLYQLVECQIKLLGEWLREPAGLHFDSGFNPANDSSLIILPTYYTPQKIVTKENDELNRLNYMLLTARLFYGDASLFNTFRTTLTSIDNSDSRKLLAEFGKAWLHDHVTAFTQYREKSFPKEVNVKEHYLQWITYLLTDLSICLNIGKSNLIEIVNALPLADHFKAGCIQAINELQTKRFSLLQQGKHTIQRNRQLDLLIEGIIEPLYANAVLLTVTRMQDAPPVDPFLLWAAQVASQDEHTRKQSLRRCASFLCYANNLEYAVTIYQSLPIEQRRNFFTALVDMGVSPAIRNALRYQPNPDGWYPAMDEETDNWLKNFGNLFQPNITEPMLRVLKGQKHTVFVRGRDLRHEQGIQEYLFQETVKAQLFEVNGEPKVKPANQRGRHTVLKVTHNGQSFWFKFIPEQAGTEYAVNRLGRYIGDQGTPMNAVIKISKGNNAEGIAVQVTPHIEGLTLEETLQNHPERLGQLSNSSFTKTLLRVLLTNPEDDKGDDYFVNKCDSGKDLFDLMRNDNERAFYDPTETTGTLKKNAALQVKSILYCLPQMEEPISEVVLMSFLALDPIMLLQRWLQELHVEHQRYQQLFTDKDVATHFTIKEPGPCLLGIPIAEGLIEELLTRLDSMQQVIRLAKQQQRPVVGMDLLKVVQPTLAEYYADAFMAIPAATAQAALQRFDRVTKGLYQRSKQGVRESRVQSAKAITQSLRLRTKLSSDVVLQMVRGQQNSPIQGLDTLQKLQSKKLEDVKQRLLSAEAKVSKPAIAEFQYLVVRQQLQIFKEVEKQHRAQALTGDQQRNVLQAIAGIPFHELSLQIFSEVLTDKLLQPILSGSGGHLLNIDLQGCWLVTDQSIEQLTQLCPNLVYLQVNHSTPSAPTISQQKLQTIKGSFPKLMTLDVSDCLDLITIDINAPQLSVLRAKKCQQLHTIKTKSLLLQHVDLRGCQQLAENGIMSLAVFAGKMQEVKLEHSDITQQIFREYYPYLMMLPLGNWSDRFVIDLTEWLEKELAICFMGAEGNIILDAHSANELYERLNQHLESIEMLYKMANDLIKGLVVNNDNKRLRIRLLGGVAGFGYNPTAILRVMLPLLKDPDDRMKRAVCEAIGNIGMYIALPDEVLTELSYMLQDSYGLFITEAAAKALGQAATQVKLPKNVVSALLLLLNHPVEEVCDLAAEVLGQVAIHNLTDIVSALLPLLKNSNVYRMPFVVKAVSEVMAQVKLPKDVVSALLPLLKSFNEKLVEATAYTLGQMARQEKLPREVVVELLGKLKDSRHEGVRKAAACALGEAATHYFADILLAVLPLLKDSDGGVRNTATKALIHLATHNSADVLSALLLLLNESDWRVIMITANTLGEVATQVKLPVSVVLTLLPLVNNSNFYVRAAVVKALGNTETQEKLPIDFVSLLLPLLKDSASLVRTAAAIALGQAASQEKLSKDVVSVLLSLLKDSEAEVRTAVAIALCQAATQEKLSRDVMSVLLSLLKDSEAEVRTAAANAFGQAATQEKFPTEVVVTLLPLLQDSALQVREATIKALSEMARYNSAEVLSALSKLLKDSGWTERKPAAKALVQAMTRNAVNEVLAFLPLLKDSEREVRVAAAKALEKLWAPNLAEIVLALLPLLKDSEWEVKVSAADALLNNFCKGAFRTNIQFALREAKNIATDNLSLRISRPPNQTNNQLNTSTTLVSTNIFWNHEMSASSSTSIHITSASSTSASTVVFK